jgi:uncharacterized protein (DUF305 family)
MKNLLFALLLPALAGFTSCREKAAPEAPAAGVEIPGLKKPDAGGPVAITRTEMMTEMDRAIQRMSLLYPNGDADYDFALMMQGHNRIAVDMAKILVEKGQDSLLKAGAARMIADREAEIKRFETIHARIFKNTPEPDPEYSQAFQVAMARLKKHSSRSEGIDRDFARLMTTHHDNAATIAEAYLKSGKEPALRAMAETIKKERPAEASVLKSWLLNHPAPAQ